MKMIITGAVLAGAATLYAAGLGHADTGTVTGVAGDWAYTYDLGGAELVQSPARTQFAWAVPATFTNNATGLTLSGIDYLRDATQGPNSEFVTDGGAVYAIDKQFDGFPTMYYAPGPGNPPGSAGEINWLFGKTPLSSGLSWLVEPADYTHAIHYEGALDKVDFSAALNLGTGGDADWTPTLDSERPVIGYQGLPMWSGEVTFHDGQGNFHTGTAYMFSPLAAVGSYHEEFVTDGATYGLDQWFAGVENLYYDPGNGGPVTDVLRTPFGEMNLSWLSWLLAPPDYANAVDATPSVPEADLLDALDFGAASQT